MITSGRRYEHRLAQGAFLEGEGIRFRLWAPSIDAVSVRIETGSLQIIPMRSVGDGWFEVAIAGIGNGTLYRYELPDGTVVPDPASRFQPQDVHGPSEVIDPSLYEWSVDWNGIGWDQVVLYELHIGSFTPEGTFRAAIGKLDHLASIGVTAIEIMPVWDFPGGRNWGYDGVLPYAPDSSYGRPDDLKALVEAAHQRGIAVLLDVVYNHFGPDGNYLPVYAKTFFTERHKTPWGAAVNYDGAHSTPVRDFIIGNALYWLKEFQFDGLRLDAVHAIIDDGPKHLLVELAERVRSSFSRPIHLLLENEDNEPRRLFRIENREAPHYTAQWNDDVHHVLHCAATGERVGYYEDYQGNTVLLGKALAEGFAYQGQTMPYRDSPRGEPSFSLPPGAFVAFIQNHDQVGNRAFGDRLSTVADKKALRALAAIYLLLPQTPMIFMGEEWGTTVPFPFFCDFSGDLADAVRKGRRDEFSRFPEFQDPQKRDQIPDPLADETFLSSKLDWDKIDAAHLEHYRSLIRTRRDAIVPVLPLIDHGGSWIMFGDAAVQVRWLARERTLTLSANLSKQKIMFPPARGELLWCEGEVGEEFGPWSVRWTMEPT